MYYNWQKSTIGYTSENQSGGSIYLPSLPQLSYVLQIRPTPQIRPMHTVSVFRAEIPVKLRKYVKVAVKAAASTTGKLQKAASQICTKPPLSPKKVAFSDYLGTSTGL